MESQPAVEVSGTFCIDDLRRLHRFQWWRFAWWGYLIVAIPLAFLVLAETRIVPTLEYWLLLTGYTIVIVGAPYLGAWNDFRKLRYLREPVVYVFTSETISIRESGVSSTIVWNILIAVRETESLFLLYKGPNSAEVVPKRFFHSSDEMVRWRRLVEACVDTRLIEKPSFIGRFC